MEQESDRDRRSEGLKAVHYEAPPVLTWCGNPCIEAIYRESTMEDIADRLRRRPVLQPGIRRAGRIARYQALQATVLDLFEPSKVHLKLAERVADAIFLGLQQRHPFKPSKRAPSTLINGFHLPGVTGMGKTWAVYEALNLFPQWIPHREYRGRRWTCDQIVWLKIDAPDHGTPKRLCIEFFRAVDKLLETKYELNYGRDGNASLDVMILGMQRVIENHALGILFIDEIQRLSMYEHQGAERLLNFLFSLKNTLHVPTVMVGDYGALPLFSKQLRLASRACGQGDLVWDRMRRSGKTYKNLLLMLFEYQVIRKPVEVNEELAEAFYYETQGITRSLLQLFLLVQRDAMDSGVETLTPEQVHRTARREEIFMQPAIEALRLGDMEALRKRPDVFPGAITPYLVNAMRLGAIEGALQDLPALQVRAAAGSKGEEDNHASNGLKATGKDRTTTRKRRRKVISREEVSYEDGSVPACGVTAMKRLNSATGATVHSALKAARFIRHAMEICDVGS